VKNAVRTGARTSTFTSWLTPSSSHEVLHGAAAVAGGNQLVEPLPVVPRGKPAIRVDHERHLVDRESLDADAGAGGA
jgi:hypothetical protein